MEIGKRIACARREMGMTQIELAEKMLVTRQTVSRWESGSVYPDIEKVPELARLLQVSCDYLLKEDSAGPADGLDQQPAPSRVTRLLKELEGKRVLLGIDETEELTNFVFSSSLNALRNKPVTIERFEGNYLLIRLENRGKSSQKLIPLSQINYFELLEPTGKEET